MNPLLDTSAIKEFLEGFPAQSRNLGKRYFASGAVRRTTCLKPGLQYSASVQGGELYDVLFLYDPVTDTWDVECTCPVTYDCKHAYAGMLALQTAANKFPGVPDSSKTGKASLLVLPNPAATARVKREEPQPPASPLATALTVALGRKLKRNESAYVMRVQRIHRDASQRGMNLGSLRELAPDLQEYGWQQIELWPKWPGDDLNFWLYCAWEMRRRNLAIPQFMLPVTDFSVIEPVIKTWERAKEIERWRGTLAHLSHLPEPNMEVLDFRLLILPQEVQVQWKNVAEEQFKNLKQSHLRTIHEGFESGTLSAVAEVASLWATIYKPYDLFTATNLVFSRPETIRILNRALRLPAIASRIVTPEGVPLGWPEEPLRYELQSAEDDAGDYHLRLLQADGKPPPPVLLTLKGQPTLYLTQHAVFRGPPSHDFARDVDLKLPAPVVESSQGVNFLQHLKIELPPRITQRMRTLALKVTLHCEVKPAYPGSNSESVYLRASLENETGESEICGASGWYAQVDPRKQYHKTFGPVREEVITVIDRSVQKQFPQRFQTLGGKWDYYSSSWKVKLTKSFPEHFLRWLETIPPEVEVLLDRSLATLRDAPLAGSVQLNVEEAGVDWFDLKVALNVTDTSLTPEELKLLLNARGGFVRLGKKGWRRLQFNLSQEEDERLARLGLDARDFTAEPQRLHALQLADEAASKFLPEEQAERIRRRVEEL
ncbi:MAG: hypothetical protein H7Y43_17745, partial [Akkermansiaceae bacterium]|nr:hypothetical protein [Verrucomicrobiales bacterium]